MFIVQYELGHKMLILALCSFHAAGTHPCRAGCGYIIDRKKGVGWWRCVDQFGEVDGVVRRCLGDQTI